MKKFGRVIDNILYYTKGDEFTWNQQYKPLSAEYIAKMYRYKDEGGRFRSDNLKAPGSPRKFEFKGHIPMGRGWAYSLEQLQEWDRQGLILHKPGGVPSFKRYLHTAKGIPVDSLFDDIENINRTKSESVGYPTQKPLALLERIIRASSNKGDMVFDPFCGCATTLVAATKLGRQWVGCDISAMAVKLVKDRLKGKALSKSLSLHEIQHPSAQTLANCLITEKARILCMENKEAIAQAAGSISTIAYWKSITSCRAVRAAPTTLITCSCFALIATAARGGALWLSGKQPKGHPPDHRAEPRAELHAEPRKCNAFLPETGGGALLCARSFCDPSWG